MARSSQQQQGNSNSPAACMARHGFAFSQQLEYESGQHAAAVDHAVHTMDAALLRQLRRHRAAGAREGRRGYAFQLGYRERARELGLPLPEDAAK